MSTYTRPDADTLRRKWMPVMNDLERHFRSTDDTLPLVEAALLLIVLYADDRRSGLPDDAALRRTFEWFKPFGVDVAAIVDPEEPTSVFAAIDAVSACVPADVLLSALTPPSEKH